MMPRVSVNRILFGALLVLAVGGWTFGGDTSKPNYEILPGMLYSIPYDAFAGNPNFPDGKTLQPPVRGTIARGQLPLNFEATPEDALRAGDELQGPKQPMTQRRCGEVRGPTCHSVCPAMVRRGKATASFRNADFLHRRHFSETRREI